MNTELAKIQHERSAKDFPEIDLDPDEHVVLFIKRSSIGIIAIWAMVGLCAILLSIILIIVAQTNSLDNTLLVINDSTRHYLRLVIVALYGVMVVGGIIGQTIYSSNNMYITNHRAIQKARRSLFTNSTNIIELKNIEDVSFRQNTLLEHIFKIGTLRMSTVGDETTYSFNFLDTPRDEVQTISHLVRENRDIGDASTTTPTHK